MSPASPEPADALFRMGKERLLAKQLPEAILLLNQALHIRPNHVDTLNCLAHCLLITGRTGEAMTRYRQALKLAPDNSIVLDGIANCYHAKGDFAKAMSYFKKSLQQSRGDLFTIFNMTMIQTPRLDAPLVKHLHELYQSAACTGEARVLVCFTLGRIHENHGDLHSAFKYYDEANRLQFPQLGYSEVKWFAYFDAIEAVLNAGVFPRLQQEQQLDIEPIFVLGMPRSGSTLVEQILSSHSAVYGVGEPDILPNIAEKLIPAITGKPYPHAIEHLTRDIVRQIADRFITELRSYCSRKYPYMVAKTLNNFLNIGLIRLLFPHAPIIHCVRDPMDNCWSMYKNHFMGSFPYCYDQTALGRYYCRYRKLMRHWHNVLPGEFHDVHYEHLVKQPDATMRAMVEYCGLPWEDRCLAFYRTQRPVATASATQVRRPIYTSSIKSWAPLAKQLSPLHEALQPCYPFQG